MSKGKLRTKVIKAIINDKEVELEAIFGDCFGTAVKPYKPLFKGRNHREAIETIENKFNKGGGGLNS